MDTVKQSETFRPSTVITSSLLWENGTFLRKFHEKQHQRGDWEDQPNRRRLEEPSRRRFAHHFSKFGILFRCFWSQEVIPILVPAQRSQKGPAINPQAPAGGRGGYTLELILLVVDPNLGNVSILNARVLNAWIWNFRDPWIRNFRHLWIGNF